MMRVGRAGGTSPIVRRRGLTMACALAALVPAVASAQSSQSAPRATVRSAQQPRDSAAVNELRRLDTQRRELERQIEALTAELQRSGDDREARAALMDSIMRLRGQELRVRARSLAVAHAVQQASRASAVSRQAPRAPRGWLGVSFEGGLVEETERGAVLVAPDYPQIFTVSPGSPAEQAGLRRGDRIVSIAGSDVRSQPLVLDDVFRPGRSVPIRVQRDGQNRQVVVHVTERPQRWVVMRAMPDSQLFASLPAWDEPWTMRLDMPDADWSGIFRMRFDSTFSQAQQDRVRVMQSLAAQMSERARAIEGSAAAMATSPRVAVRVMTRTDGAAVTPFVMFSGDMGYALGARLTTLSPMLRAELSAPEGGLLILEIAPATPAERAGLRPLDVIVKADGKLVTNPADLARAISQRDSKSLRLELVRRGRAERTTVNW